MNLYEIRDLASKSGRAVFSVQQLANLISKSKAIAKVYSSRLVKKHLAHRLTRGKISFSKDDEVISTQMIEPSYVSLTSALLFHQLVQQVPANTECVTTKNSIQYKRFGIIYHKIPVALFYGFEKHRKGTSYVFVAEAEKALIDSVYLNLIPKKVAKELSAKMDQIKLKSYVERFNRNGRKKLERWLL